MERESSNECSVFFSGLRKAFNNEIVLRGFDRCFLRRRSAKCPVLKFNQGSEVFEDVLGSFFALQSGKIRFRAYINVSQTFYKFLSLALRNNYKMHLDLRWVLCSILPCVHPIYLLLRTNLLVFEYTFKTLFLLF